MNMLNSIILLSVMTVLSSACVRRTTSIDPQHQGTASADKSYGSASHGDVIDKKIVWIWQDEFRNPK